MLPHHRTWLSGSLPCSSVFTVCVRMLHFIWGVYDCDGWISPSGGSVIITPRCPLLALHKIKMLAHHFFFLFLLLLLLLQWEDLFIIFSRHTCSWMSMLFNVRRIRRLPRQPCQVINSQTFHLDSLPAKMEKGQLCPVPFCWRLIDLLIKLGWKGHVCCYVHT